MWRIFWQMTGYRRQIKLLIAHLNHILQAVAFQSMDTKQGVGQIWLWEIKKKQKNLNTKSSTHQACITRFCTKSSPRARKHPRAILRPEEETLKAKSGRSPPSLTRSPRRGCCSSWWAGPSCSRLSRRRRTSCICEGAKMKNFFGAHLKKNSRHFFCRCQSSAITYEFSCPP